MNVIVWFNSNGDSDVNGRWALRSDVEALQAEMRELLAKALAAVWLIPEDENHGRLLELREEAREVFMGKHKQVIAKLQNELRCSQEAYQHAMFPPRLGVNEVLGVNRNSKAKLHFALPILKVTSALNGGLVIEVQLP